MCPHDERHWLDAPLAAKHLEFPRFSIWKKSQKKIWSCDRFSYENEDFFPNSEQYEASKILKLIACCRYLKTMVHRIFRTIGNPFGAPNFFWVFLAINFSEQFLGRGETPQTHHMSLYVCVWVCELGVCSVFFSYSHIYRGGMLTNVRHIVAE